MIAMWAILAIVMIFSVRNAPCLNLNGVSVWMETNKWLLERGRR